MADDKEREMEQAYGSEHRAATGERNDGRWVLGAILVALGLLALSRELLGVALTRLPFSPLLVLNLGSPDLLFLPLLGAVFMVWGAAARKVGLMVPGGILGGIGTGVLMIEGPLRQLDGQARAGVFMLSFAMGWVAIAVVASVFVGREHWWPLIPAAVIGGVGALLAFGLPLAHAFWTVVGTLWPLALVAMGLALIVRYLRRL